MSTYVLIASEDPLEHAERFYALALQLRDAGHTVTLFLVQNAVLGARAARARTALPTLLEASVTILADEFSLRERGIAAIDLRDGIHSAPLDVLTDLLARGHKALWN